MKQSRGYLSGNALKIIAAISMTADHVGLMFFPNAQWLRILGRLAYPIFAYMIAQGCRYTRSRGRYLGQIAGLAALCQLVYYIADRDLYMSILVTFSCSIVMIFALQELQTKPKRGAPMFLASLAAVWWLNQVLTIDYGFWGCMVPVLAYVFQFRQEPEASWQRSLDRKEVHILTLTLGLLFLAADLGGNQIWSLLALPLLLCYSGKRGKWRMKYFFYIFYPLHLALLQCIAWLVY